MLPDRSILIGGKCQNSKIQMRQFGCFSNTVGARRVVWFQEKRKTFPHSFVTSKCRRPKNFPNWITNMFVLLWIHLHLILEKLLQSKAQATETKKSFERNARKTNEKKLFSSPLVVAKLCIHTKKLENIAKVFFPFSIPGFCYNNGGGDYPDDLASQPLPRIISRGETIRAAFGERVQLPCHVEQLGK